MQFEVFNNHAIVERNFLGLFAGAWLRYCRASQSAVGEAKKAETAIFFTVLVKEGHFLEGFEASSLIATGLFYPI